MVYPFFFRKSFKEGRIALNIFFSFWYGLWTNTWSRKRKEELETRIKFPSIIWEEHVQGSEKCKGRSNLTMWYVIMFDTLTRSPKELQQFTLHLVIVPSWKICKGYCPLKCPPWGKSGRIDLSRSFPSCINQRLPPRIAKTTFPFHFSLNLLVVCGETPKGLHPNQLMCMCACLNMHVSMYTRRCLSYANKTLIWKIRIQTVTCPTLWPPK